MQLVDLAGAESACAVGSQLREPPWSLWAASGVKPERRRAYRWMQAAVLSPATVTSARASVDAHAAAIAAPATAAPATAAIEHAAAMLQHFLRGRVQHRRCVAEVRARLERRREGAFIHESLQALTELLHSMRAEPTSLAASAGQDKLFERSVLARLLHSALTGDSAVCVFLCVSPHANCVERARQTLEFGAAIKDVRTKAKRRNLSPMHTTEV